MKKAVKIIFAILFLAISGGFSWAVMNYDVQPIGPNGSSVGFATINKQVFELLGTKILYYEMTDLLGKLSLGIVGIFALVGLIQLIGRKSFKKVDKEIYGLGFLYVITFGIYVFFEKFIVNYRPIIMEGASELEASFPSSHTMLACVIFGSTILVLDHFLKNKALKVAIQLILWCLTIAMIAGRLMSGVHWASDICAGVLYSITLLLFFSAFITNKEKKQSEEDEDELVYKNFSNGRKEEKQEDYVKNMIYEQKIESDDIDEEESKRRLEECLARLRKEIAVEKGTNLVDGEDETILLNEDGSVPVVDAHKVINEKPIVHYEPRDDFDISFYTNVLLEGKKIEPNKEENITKETAVKEEKVSVKQDDGFDVSFYINTLLEGKTIVPIRVENKKEVVKKEEKINYEPINDFDISFYTNVLLDGKTIEPIKEEVKKVVEKKIENKVVTPTKTIEIDDIDYVIAPKVQVVLEDEIPIVECNPNEQKIVIEIKEIY